MVAIVIMGDVLMTVMLCCFLILFDCVVAVKSSLLSIVVIVGDGLVIVIIGNVLMTVKLC